MPGMDGDAGIYLRKAGESLLSAESELGFGRYNSCANRCYDACFQAAIAALLLKEMRPTGKWTHEYVQAQFAGQLVNRRKRYGADLRRVLLDNYQLRIDADYRTEMVNRAEASAAWQPSIRGRCSRERGTGPMIATKYIPITPAIEAAIGELRGVIAERFPTATFEVEEGTDPLGIFLDVTVDLEDTFEVIDLVGDRLLEMQVEEGLPIYVIPSRPVERTLAELRARDAAERLQPTPSRGG